MSKRDENAAGMGEAFLIEGRIAFMSGNTRKAIDLDSQAAAIFQREGLTKQMIRAWMNIGNAAERLGQYADAIETYQQVFQRLDDNEETDVLAEAHNELGVVYFRMGNDVMALENYLAALRIYTARGDQEAAASVFSNIGLIHVRKGEPEKAIDYFQQAIAGSRDPDSSVSAAKAHANLGTALARRGLFDEAIAHHHMALGIFECLNDRSGLAEGYSGLGIMYFNQAMYPEALSCFERSAQLSRETGNRIYLASALTNAGNAYSSLGDLAGGESAAGLYRKALANQREGIAIADSIGAKETLAGAYDAITFTYKGLGDTENALEYTERLLLLKDSLRSSKVDQQLDALRTQYEVERAIDQEKNRHNRRIERAWLTTAGLALLGLLFFGHNRQQTRRKRERERADALRRMAELELQSLRAQLNPHFMFNALNAIQELILRHENDQGHLYLAQFSQLLRMLLERADVPLIPLSKELEFLDTYLKLEKLRLPDLEIDIDVATDIQPREVMVPSMMLQPHLENAIWHGLSHKPWGDRRISIRIRRDREQIVYMIADNGIGRTRAAEINARARKSHRSKGLELLDKRMALIRERFDLEIDTRIEDVRIDGTASGTCVTIRTPVAFTPMTDALQA